MSCPSGVADVVVVGAGIVGASVAYHLACAGAEVVLLDSSLPASGASGASFAWIGRGTAGAPPEELLLRRDVLEDWRRLEEELVAVRVRWSGSLSWGVDEPTLTHDDVAAPIPEEAPGTSSAGTPTAARPASVDDVPTRRPSHTWNGCRRPSVG